MNTVRHGGRDDCVIIGDGNKVHMKWVRKPACVGDREGEKVSKTDE